MHIDWTRTSPLLDATVVVAHLSGPVDSAWRTTFEHLVSPAMLGLVPHLDGDRVHVIVESKLVPRAEFVLDQAVWMTNLMRADALDHAIVDDWG